MKTTEFMGLTLVLDTRAKIKLEEKLGGSPLQFVFNMMGGAMTEDDIDMTKMQVPPLKVMVLTIHAAAQKLNANTSIDKVMDKVDEYLEEKSVMELFTVFMELLQVGKYLPEVEEE